MKIVLTAFEIPRWQVKYELTERKFGEHDLKFGDIKDEFQFWEWFHDGLLPILVRPFHASSECQVRQTDELGTLLPTSKWGYAIAYNRVIGGIRLIQDRGRNEKCRSKGGNRLKEFYKIGNCQSGEKPRDRACRKSLR